MKGGKRENAGRKKGIPNKSTAEVRDVVESIMPREERFALLAKLAKKGNYRALELLCYYGDGKPRETVDVSHSGEIKFIEDNI